jgi:hypothetical protein
MARVATRNAASRLRGNPAPPGTNQIVNETATHLLQHLTIGALGFTARATKTITKSSECLHWTAYSAAGRLEDRVTCPLRQRTADFSIRPWDASVGTSRRRAIT